MPRISAFYGIVITMYYRDHEPPHFHAVYGEYQAQIVIATLEPLNGELPARALRLVREWAELHRAELDASPRGARRELGEGSLPRAPRYHCTAAMSTQPSRVRSVEPLDGFVLRLSFHDGTQRDVDLEGELWGPMFEPLRLNPELFRQVHVDEELGTIVWPNGADMDPDVLHGDFDPADTAATPHVSHAER